MSVVVIALSGQHLALRIFFGAVTYVLATLALKAVSLKEYRSLMERFA
jgi:hypothetical protein